MRQATVREAILRYLATTERGYGLEMMRAIDCRSGSLYPALGWLEDHGFIRGDWETSNERGPRRRYYQLTAAGRKGDHHMSKATPHSRVRP